MRSVVCNGTAFLSLQLISMVVSSGETSSFPISAVLSSSKVSICKHNTFKWLSQDSRCT